MAGVAYLDTHVMVWLYQHGADGISETAAACIRAAEDRRISPMVRLEMQYLYEIGRVARPAAPVLDELSARLGLSVCRTPFAEVVLAAEADDWTRDPFDRLIVAQAAARNAPLVTKDAAIHAHYSKALW